jgi:hypothetical protein
LRLPFPFQSFFALPYSDTISAATPAACGEAIPGLLELAGAEIAAVGAARLALQVQPMAIQLER